MTLCFGSAFGESKSKTKRQHSFPRRSIDGGLFFHFIRPEGFGHGSPRARGGRDPASSR